MTFAYGVYAYGQLPDEYDSSVADPFAALLADPNAQLLYLVELYPYNAGLAQTIVGMAPYGVNTYSQFDFTVLGGVSAVYLSDAGFITEPTDVLISQYFNARVDNPLQYESSILSGGEFSAGNQSFGSVVINNADGELDALERYFWSSRRVVVKAGTKGFRYSDFATVFDGAANGIDGDEDRLTITIQDNKIKTDQPLLPGNYAGTGDLEGGLDIANKSKPLCYGVVNNVEPVLVNAASLIYQIHDGSIGYVTAVRDAGVRLNNGGDVLDIQAASVAAGYFKTDLSKGYIKLGSTPSGRITVDAQGENSNGGYVSSIGNIVKRIVKTRLGANSLDDGSIDLGSLSRLDLAVPGDVGIYIPDQTTASSVIDELINSVGGYWSFTRQGQLQAGIIASPVSPTVTITADQMSDEGIKIANTTPASWRISIGYAPASVVQSEDELAGATTTTDRAFVSQQYRFVTVEDDTVKTRNAQAVERVFLTRLANKTDAQTLLARLSSIYATRRRVYQVTIYRTLFRLYIGDTVKLVYNRFGMENGLILLVTGISEDAETGQTTLELWG